MKVRDLRNNEEEKAERDTQDEAYQITGWIHLVTDAVKKPGAWIKRYGYSFKHLKDFKVKHFQNAPVGLLGSNPDPLEKEKEKYKNIPYGH